MPQLTIYLDAKAERLIARAAKRDAVSLSRWAREKLLLAAGAPSWPSGYRSVLGSIDDETFTSPEDRDASRDQPASFGG
jgi:hypothetical protein